MFGLPIGRALGVAAVTMSMLAPSALAAPPANDDFADREVLSGSLPIEVSRSNVEATKESEEFFGPAFGAGHSVWFEWEATSSGFVTVGACEREIETVLGVYTGDAVNALTKVADGNPSEGPHCPFGQREYTFKATSGTAYKIAVDGNGFSFPGGPKPITEGGFTLRIEATPPPVNDDFADATSLVTGLEEEFEGQAFYFGSRFGYNWNATLESGEPEHVGGPNGASVWYSWTAPVSGEAKVGACCNTASRLSMYTGDSLEDLELRFGGIGQAGFATFMASAGTTYRFAVYGLLDESSGEVSTASFSLQVSLRAPVPAEPGGGQAAPAPPPSPDVTPPDTRIRKTVLRRMPPIWSFRFESTEPNSTFRCRLDRRPFRKCGAGKRYGHLPQGRHTLKVFAVDRAGNPDPSPAVARFTIPDVQKNRSRR